jgi:hypothetical protein
MDIQTKDMDSLMAAARCWHRQTRAKVVLEPPIEFAQKALSLEDDEPDEARPMRLGGSKLLK